MTFGSNAGVEFDGLLLIEKPFDLQNCETLKGHVFLHSVAPSELGDLAAITLQYLSQSSSYTALYQP